MGPSTAHAQVTTGAGAGSIVPFAVAGHHFEAGGGIDRLVSSVNPYTLAAARVGTTLGSSKTGFAIAFGGDQALNLAGTPLFGVLQTAAWRQMGDVTLRFDVSSYAARVSNFSLSNQPAEQWTDSSGYQVLRTDSVQTLQDPRLRLWSQLETTASWQRGRFRWDAVVGARPPVAGLPAAVWGRVGTSWRAFRGLAVIAEAGSLPAQVALNVPSARFVHLGFQLTPFGGNTDDRVTPARPAAAFSVRPVGPQQYAITLRVTGATTVEIAGDFDRWHPIPLSLVHPGVWQVRVGMVEGTYRMNVRIDGGAWTAPPGAATVTDEFGGTVGLVQVR